MQIDIPVLRIVDQKHTQGFVFHEYSNLYRPSGVLEWSVRVDSQPYVREYIIRRLDEYDFSLSDWSFSARYYRDTTGWGFPE